MAMSEIQNLEENEQGKTQERDALASAALQHFELLRRRAKQQVLTGDQLASIQKSIRPFSFHEDFRQALYVVYAGLPQSSLYFHEMASVIRVPISSSLAVSTNTQNTQDDEDVILEALSVEASKAVKKLNRIHSDLQEINSELRAARGARD